MLKLVCLFVTLLIAKINCGSSERSAANSQQVPDFCKFVIPIAEYNFKQTVVDNKTQNDPDLVNLNLVHPRSNKSTIFLYHPKYLRYELDGKNFEHIPNFHDSGCDCLKEVEKKVPQPGTILEYFTKIQCLHEECTQSMTNAKKDELQALFMQNPNKFCALNDGKQYCVCYEEKYYSLAEKYFETDSQA